MRSPVVKKIKLTPGKTFFELMDITFLGTPVNLTDFDLCFLLEESEGSDNFYSYTNTSGEITQPYLLTDPTKILIKLNVVETSKMSVNPPSYWKLIVEESVSGYQEILAMGSVLRI